MNQDLEIEVIQKITILNLLMFNVVDKILRNKV